MLRRSEQGAAGGNLPHLSAAQAIAVVLVMLVLNGCSAPHPPLTFASLEPIKTYHGTDWQDAVVVDAGRYRVITNTDQATGLRAGLFLQRCLGAYQQVTGMDPDTLPVMTVSLYARRRIYEQEAGRLGLPGRVTTGFYSPRPPAAMHVPWLQVGGDHPLLTMIHEGFHQFANQAALADRRLNPAGEAARLPVLAPLWLNEGIALFMEGAIVSEARLEPGRINPTRLVRLQRLIRDGKYPDLQDLLSRRYGEPFSRDDYAAAWGVAFALYHGLSADGTWSGGQLLNRYIGGLKEQLYNEVRVVPADQYWPALLVEPSVKVFDSLLAEQGTSLSEWDNAWRAAMLELQADVPSGGLMNSSR